jgi:hypothetical protein
MIRFKWGLALAAMAFGVLIGREVIRMHDQHTGAQPMSKATRSDVRGIDPEMIILRDDASDNGMVVRTPFDGDPNMAKTES